MFEYHALQSLNKTIQKYNHPFSVVTLSPILVDLPIIKAVSNSISNNLLAPKTGTSESAVCLSFGRA